MRSGSRPRLSRAHHSPRTGTQSEKREQSEKLRCISGGSKVVKSRVGRTQIFIFTRYFNIFSSFVAARGVDDVVVAQAQTLPREHAPNASSRGTVVEAQVRLAKSEIEPVILAPSSFPLHFGGGGRAVRGQQWRGARRRRPRKAASRVDAAHDARGLQPVHLRQRRRRVVALSVRCAHPICRAMK